MIVDEETWTTLQAERDRLACALEVAQTEAEIRRLALLAARQEIAALDTELRQVKYEASLLAEAWTLVAPIVTNWSDRPGRLGPINALAERHYARPEI